MFDKDLQFRCRHLINAILNEGRNEQPDFRFLTVMDYRVQLERLSRKLSDDGLAVDFPGGPTDVLEFIVQAGPDAGRGAFREMRRWLAGAQRVELCDPFLMKFPPSPMFASVEEYAQALGNIFPPSVKHVDLFYNGYSKKVRPSVKRQLKEGRRLIEFNRCAIHDRFVVKDGREGKLIGTSFGGFGKKFFALIDLPSSDVKQLRAELDTLRQPI